MFLQLAKVLKKSDYLKTFIWISNGDKNSIIELYNFQNIKK